jgi:hypothetical protein
LKLQLGIATLGVKNGLGQVPPAQGPEGLVECKVVHHFGFGQILPGNDCGIFGLTRESVYKG